MSKVKVEVKFNNKTLSETKSEVLSVPDYSEESVMAVARLEKVLRRINSRLRNDGYCIKDGKLTKV